MKGKVVGDRKVRQLLEEKEGRGRYAGSGIGLGNPGGRSCTGRC